MAGRTVTVELPDDLYDRLERRAMGARRSVAAEVVHVLAQAVPSEEERLPPDIEEELARMEALDDAALRRAAASGLTPRQSRRLESLHLHQQSDGLNEAEQQEERTLLDAYRRALLIRGQALAVLKQRGQDITPLLMGR